MRSARNFWRAFTSIFKPKKIIFLGRTGMTFFDEGKIYFLDSELLEGEEDVVIYDNKIYYIENGSKVFLSEKEGNEILKKIEMEMEKTGLVVIMPERYNRWKESIQ